MQDEETKEIRYADLFGGVGGFRLGIERAINNRFIQQKDSQGQMSNPNRTTSQYSKSFRAKCVFYSDNDKYAVQTYNKNFNENHKPTDIRNISTDDIPEIDMLCGGFPCQAFSIAGKRRGFQDTRGTLFFEIARIIKAKRPKIIFLENVKGLLNHNKGQTFRTILQTISELGYDVQWLVLNSKFFGVPQNRERVFIIGSLRGTSRPEILPFREKYEEDIELQRQQEYTNTIQEGVARDRQGSFVAESLKFAQAQRIRNTEGVAQTLQGQAGGQGAKTGLYAVQPAQLVNKNRAKKPYNPNDREMKIKVRDDETSYTIKSATHEFMVKQDMKIRRLTPTECERLQGFPEGWTEGVSDTQRYKQMGNAVTVNVIEAIARRLLKE